MSCVRNEVAHGPNYSCRIQPSLSVRTSSLSNTIAASVEVGCIQVDQLFVSPNQHTHRHKSPNCGRHCKTKPKPTTLPNTQTKFASIKPGDPCSTFSGTIMIHRRGGPYPGARCISLFILDSWVQAIDTLGLTYTSLQAQRTSPKTVRAIQPSL
jgi:hypothetical protein